MWNSEQKIMKLVKYRSADRIQAEMELRSKIKTVKNILQEKKWRSIDYAFEQHIVMTLPEHVFENTIVEMQLTTTYFTQKHSTEYVISGKINYAVTKNAFSTSPSIQYFVKNIKHTHTYSKENTIVKFIYAVKQSITRIQEKFEDPDEYS